MELSLEDYNKKINHAKAYASAILDNLDPRLKYHSKQHTIAVFRIAMILAEKEGLSLEEKLLLSIAALFHDTGFLHQYQENEPYGAKEARNYMALIGYSEEQISIVESAILNTNMKEQPKNKIEQILRDADLAYLGFRKRGFISGIEKLRQETSSYKKSHLYNAAQSEESWYRSSIGFMERHEWFSNAAKELLGEKKRENLEYLKRQLEQLRNNQQA